MGIFGNNFIKQRNVNVEVIGDIDFDETLNEVNIGDIELKSPKGKCRVEIRTNDAGQIPHFHIVSYNKKDKNKKKKYKFDCCIQITNSMYFSHGNHSDTLTNSECEKLNKWLEEKPTTGSYKDEARTRWEQMKMVWNNGILKNKSINKPNYDIIEPYIER